ncbi:MAG: S9 family peptidase [Planctomycetota bacterium]
MNEVRTAPYGTWKSPITAELIVAESVGLSSPRVAGKSVYWLEMRPSEGGRYVVVHRDSEGQTVDITPPGFNVRTRVHEYGGAAWTLDDETATVYFANFDDQRLYRQRPGERPQPLTPEVDRRYADFVLDSRRNRLVSVLEDHTTDDRLPTNALAAVSLASGEVQVLASGYDFYSSPRLSPDGKQLSWVCWNFPNMPWDGAELWVAEIDDAGALGEPVLVAGGEEEAIFQPEWSPDGRLFFISDRTGWWNLYRWQGQQVRPVLEMEADFGKPHWMFGFSTYAFGTDEEVLCTYASRGVWHLGRIDIDSGELTPVHNPFTVIADLHAQDQRAAFVGAGPADPATVVLADLDAEALQPLRRATRVEVDPGYVSVPEAIEFPTTDGLTAHGLYYPPANQDYIGPADELPPLIVHSHGGPTSAADSGLKLGIQYWTSRGLAVLDVNYGGSTGYGREYRNRLRGQWGIVDVDDCGNGAKYLAESGLVDPERMAITGGSAGGYTTLAALTFRDVFAAGASHFGVSDPAALAQETHKFESRYLDRLIAPYPAREDLYNARSPIHHAEQLSCPVIFFQGLEDKIVPPNQAERMVDALRKKGIPVAYLPFEGEQHGFRRAENIKRALEAELLFFGRVFGFQPADDIEPVEIENM